MTLISVTRNSKVTSFTAPIFSASRFHRAHALVKCERQDRTDV